MKQSAVEFLLENIEILIKQGHTFNPIFKYYFIEQAKEMENQQQDELAIGFIKWYASNEGMDLIHDLEIVGEIDINITPEKLLEIYKKEKGL